MCGGAADQVELRRPGIGPPVVGRHGRRTRVGRVVVQRVEDLRAGHAVDRRVVHLEEDREAARRHTLDRVEALDEIQLPRRPVHVQRPLPDPRPAQ